ncbi:cytochrome P450 1A1 isoform X2 [Ornithorhynchus anatinus]|uniref:cytochrome P450 1A1 isoform X2 n=1 Tax=Ornithorhynchus anatinus TaxID=9258 RepID=UPI0010A879F0|nr:cytochrome P450 1A1 isoform X2 [Ornithorhynchus anatinus]
MIPGELTTSLLMLVIVLISINVLRNRGQKPPSPPGPWALPVIGNLLQLGEHPYLSFIEMRKKYGDVFLIKLGMVPVVVVNGMEPVKRVLFQDGENYAGRPNMHTFSFFANGKSLSFSTNYGDSWKHHKKMAINALKSFSKAEAKSSTCSCLLEEHVCGEVSELVKIFTELTATQGNFDPRGSLTCAVANVVCALCFGKRYEHTDEKFLKVIKINDDLLKASSAVNPADFIPCFRYLPLRVVNAPREYYHMLNQFIMQHVQEHYVTYDEGYLRDITDALISICYDKNSTGKTPILPDDTIISTVNDIFGAGFDTVSTCLNWSFLYLINYPEIQTKIQAEIDGNIGLKPPRFEDRKNLPYTEAFINEIFRHTTFLPFTIPHCTTADTILNGYFIPQKTCVFVNIYQVNHDESPVTFSFKFTIKSHRRI